MKTIKVKDSNGVTHNYNPKYIKDIQEVENHHNNEWCRDGGITGYTYLLYGICLTNNNQDNGKVLQKTF